MFWFTSECEGRTNLAFFSGMQKHTNNIQVLIYICIKFWMKSLKKDCDLNIGKFHGKKLFRRKTPKIHRKYKMYQTRVIDPNRFSKFRNRISVRTWILIFAFVLIPMKYIILFYILSINAQHCLFNFSKRKKKKKKIKWNAEIK